MTAIHYEHKTKFKVGNYFTNDLETFTTHTVTLCQIMHNGNLLLQVRQSHCIAPGASISLSSNVAKGDGAAESSAKVKPKSVAFAE